MSDDIAIRVVDVKKSFKLPHQKTDSLKGAFINVFNKKKTFERQQVLKGVSFDVKKGEFLGIVGRNGGGKSTMLKLLAQIYLPDSGTIDVNGSLTPFIELGVGFNPDLTGRENVYLNGSLLGLTRKAIDEMYDDIVKFAELERFMDQKLKNYSSGMQVRLAFTVAIQAQTDILLIDEVLAVGDANFQKKCFDVFEKFKAEGRTVIFISHSMAQVTRFCDRVILLNKGKIMAEGEPEVVATEYDMLNNESQKDNKGRMQPKTIRESHLVESILNEFKTEDKLLNIGAGKGRIAELINSLNITTVGIDKDEGDSRGPVFKSITDLKRPGSITGMFIDDNLKSLSPDFITTVFSELKPRGLLESIQKIYVHIPFELYQRYMRSVDSGSSPHLGDPLDIIDIAEHLKKYKFSITKLETYGEESHQYVECVFNRFDDKEVVKLWGSSDE